MALPSANLFVSVGDMHDSTCFNQSSQSLPKEKTHLETYIKIRKLLAEYKDRTREIDTLEG